MKPSIRLLFALGTLLAIPAVNVFAQAAAEPEDFARDTIDPYNPGFERSRFLAAAGVDNELDEKEFKENQSARNPFVRKFDSWSSMKRFDKDNSNTIDWFEADGYRRAVRDAVMVTYDANHNGRLDDAERLAANKDLASGRAPRLDVKPATSPAPRVTVVGPDVTSNNNNDPNRSDGNVRRGNEWDLNGDGKFDEDERKAWQEKQQERYKQWQEEYTRKWDKNGDGKVDQEEQKIAQEAAMKEWREKNPEQARQYDERMAAWKKQQEEYVKKWDANGDGELDANEHKAANEARMKEWREQNPEAAARWEQQQEENKKRMEEWTKKWDTNGDGQVTGDEQKAAQEAYMEEWKKRDPEAYERWQKQQEDFKKQQEERVRRFDKNGDGQLSTEEWQDAMKTEREERERNGQGNRGIGGNGGSGGNGGFNGTYRVSPGGGVSVPAGGAGGVGFQSIVVSPQSGGGVIIVGE